MSTKIPFHKARSVGHENQYVRDVLESGAWSGDKSFGKRAEKYLEKVLGASRVLLTPSCTAALEMMALLLDLKAGDEVIMPSFTFPTTASAVALRGATPVFADIEPGTLNLDPVSVSQAMSKRTRAIMVVHYAGNSCQMDEFRSLVHGSDVALLEDAAQGLGASYQGRALGVLGDLGALSFHETKNVSCGEGGALILTSPKWIERAEILREKGTNRSMFLRGEVDKYTWRDLGSSYVLGEFNAAVLCAQLERAESVTAERVEIWKKYATELSDLEATGKVSLPRITKGASPNGHIFWLMLKGADEREALQNHLREHGIQSTSHFVPLHNSIAGQKYGRPAGSMQVTEAAAVGILRLPSYVGLGADQDRVIEAVKSYFLS